MNHFKYLGIAAAIGLFGCSNPEPGFDHLDYSDVSLAPLEAKLAANEIALPEGIVVKARVRAIDDAGEPMGGVRLRSATPELLDVQRGPDGTWLFIGVKPGKTHVLVSTDGPDGRVNAEVLPQE